MPVHQKDEIYKDEKRPVAPSPSLDVQAQKNIESIMRLEKKAIHSRSTSEQIADKVANVAGRMPFIICHVLWFGGWILINVGVIPGVRPFDPFPFNFLTLVVSLEAIFLSLLVLMSQNRMIKESDKRAHLDLQVNMLAEQEGTMVLRMLERIGKHLGLEEKMEEEMRQLEEKTDVDHLAQTLEEKLSNPTGH